MKAMSLRLDDQLAEEVALVARIKGISATDAVREALSRYVAAHMSSGEFSIKLRERVQADQEIAQRYWSRPVIGGDRDHA